MKKVDARFHAALRLDRLLNGWTQAVPLIKNKIMQFRRI